MAAAEAAQSYSSVAFGCWQLGNKASTGDYWGTEYTDDMAIKMVNPRLSARCLVLTS
jgi:aryl-alcohol dehydrogenase-like predicted oxidoreductase